MIRPPINDFLNQSQSQISDPVCHIPVRGEIWLLGMIGRPDTSSPVRVTSKRAYEAPPILKFKADDHACHCDGKRSPGRRVRNK